MTNVLNSTTAATDSMEQNGSPKSRTHYEVAIIGAGFSGLYLLQRLRKSFPSIRVFDANATVGGTWSRNRYPGARTDNEAWYYCYSFSPELCSEWNWTERYASQPEVQAYFEHVVERFQLRSQIQLNTEILSARYDEAANIWELTSEQGERFTCRYLIAATGLLSTPYQPKFNGVESFRGECYAGWDWPGDTVDYAGKRVGIIGTGSTATQMTPILAESVEHLYIFKRTAQYVIEAQNRRLDGGEMDRIRDGYDDIWRRVRAFPTLMDFEFSGRSAKDASPEERERIFEEGWRLGGFRFLYETFDDVVGDLEANEYAADFIRRKIREIVVDPDIAERLTPRGYPIGSKRPVVGHHFYETFNRSNVTLVDVENNGIEGFSPNGIIANGTTYEVDIAVIATGFDAYTGALTTMNVEGRDGLTLATKWRDGVKTYLGVAYAGFPNLFAVNGPHTPFANLPSIAEKQGEWIAAALEWMANNGVDSFEPERDAEDEWVEQVRELGTKSLLPYGSQVGSWYYGANIPGKVHEPLMFPASHSEYFQRCREVAEAAYRGFVKTQLLEPTGTDQPRDSEGRDVGDD
jgi:cation diffusion facilitator CzcD-associated flavoprotein CzcO